METKRICLIHLNQIGDLVFSLPLLKALREAYPKSEIHSILRPHLKELLTHSPYIDQLIDRESGIKDNLRLLCEMRQHRYDLLISLSNSVECLLLTTLSRARRKVGFRSFPWDFSLDMKEKVEGHPSWYNNFKLLRGLDIEVKKRDYVGLMHLPPEDGSTELARAKLLGTQGRYVVISPGTSLRRRIKAWGEEKFRDLIISLKGKKNLSPVLVGGKEDREGNDQIIELIKQNNKRIGPIINLAGEVSLKNLCYLLKNATLFVGVDSGIMHLASAFGIPVVGIFGPTDPFYVGPQNTKSIVVRGEGLKCVPCYLKGCEERTCMKKLGVEKVLEACEQVLNQ